MRKYIPKRKVRHLARLARIAIGPEEVARLQRDMKLVLRLFAQLEEVDVANVRMWTPPMPMRKDVVTDGNIADDILKNAPAREGPFFTVPGGKK